jgi:hypothetical protein
MDLDTDYYLSRCKDINGLWVFKGTVITVIDGGRAIINQYSILTLRSCLQLWGEEALKACFNECPLGHYLYFPHRISSGFMQKVLKMTHYFWVPTPPSPFHIRRHPPTTLTNSSHPSSNTGFTIVMIFWLGLSWIDRLHLKLLGVGCFKVGWEIMSW